MISRVSATIIALVVVATVTSCGQKPAAAPVLPSPIPSPSPIPKPVALGPVKGLSDNPAFQWWRWPGGAQPDSWWGANQTPVTLGEQTGLMQELGVKIFRVELVWAFVEPTMPGGSAYDSQLARDPDWSGYQWQRWDMIVDTATEAGLQLLPVVYYTPTWAGGVRLTINGGPNAPPTSAQFYGDFMHALVLRYSDRIHYWELGNEPDFGPRSWNGTLKQYVDLMLRPGYQGVKEVDPSAKVLLGGLAVDTHMTSMYAAGAAGAFDIASFHAYYAAASGDSTALDHVRAAMNENGDNAKPIWLTEFGMATRAAALPPPSNQPNDAGEQAQAQLIHDVYGGLKAQAIFFYELHDTAVYGAGGPIKFVYWGLVSHDFTYRKAGLDAYASAASGDLPQPA